MTSDRRSNELRPSTGCKVCPLTMKTSKGAEFVRCTAQERWGQELPNEQLSALEESKPCAGMGSAKNFSHFNGLAAPRRHRLARSEAGRRQCFIGAMQQD
jgi:hypothetical protein